MILSSVPVPLLEDLTNLPPPQRGRPAGRSYLRFVTSGEDVPAKSPVFVRLPRWARRLDVALGYDAQGRGGNLGNVLTSPFLLVGFYQGGPASIYDVPSQTGEPDPNTVLIGQDLAGRPALSGPVRLDCCGGEDVIIFPTGLRDLEPGDQVAISLRIYP